MFGSRTEKRDKLLGVNLTESEQKYLKDLQAQAAQETLSDLVRAMVRFCSDRRKEFLKACKEGGES